MLRHLALRGCVLSCFVMCSCLWDKLNMSLSCCGEITCRTKAVGSPFLAQALPPQQAIQMRSPLNLETVIWYETETVLFFFLILEVRINFCEGQRGYQRVLFPFVPYALGQ